MRIAWISDSDPNDLLSERGASFHAEPESTREERIIWVVHWVHTKRCSIA